jgi:protein-disulfide isomerase/uncharacterized membrane protein YphA (DoxX/SURF4 family)
VRWAGVVARLVLGAVWVVAGWLKLGDPTENVRAVRAYELLPESIVPTVGHTLPVLELLLGLCLLVGLFTRWSALVSGLLLLAFVIGISSAWARGLSIECGCFGGGGGPARGAAAKYPWDIARDVGLLLLSAFLVWRPRTPYSLDEVLLPAVGEAPAVAEPQGSGKRAARARAAARAAAIRREAEASAARRRATMTTAVGLLALVLVVAVGGAVQADRDRTGVVARAPHGAVDRYAFAVGPAHAKVGVDIYEDFMCPFCGQFEAESRPIVAGYGGRSVQFRYHVISFLDRASTTEYSSRAANALAVVLDTSGPEVAKKFHDAVYADQPAEGSAGLSDQDLIDKAVAAGAKADAVSGPIRDRAFSQWVTNATDTASRQGINSTPTVFVDGKLLPPAAIPATVHAMQAAIEKGLS